jgi:hypothetical protein
MYKYNIGKKIVKNPLRIVNKITIANINHDSILNKFTNIDSLELLKELLKENEYPYIELISLNEKEVDYILDIVSSYIEVLELFRCESKVLSLNKCIKLKELSLKYLDNLTTLDSLINNKELIKLEIISCYNLIDLNGIKDSSLVNIIIKDGYKTIPDRLNINIDFNIFKTLKDLKELSLFTLNNLDKEKDLKVLSELTNLEYLRLPKDYFTFKEFAYLKSKLINTNGLDCIYHIAKDPSNELVYYIVIGKDKEDFLYLKDIDYNVFIDEYNKLIEEYKGE